MRKHRISALIALMLCLPLTMLAKVEHLLPKVHSLTETKGTPFALQRTVTITDANNTAALRKVFTDYGCTIEDGAAATVTVQMVESIEGAYDYTLEGYDNEGYQLIVAENAITIKAVKPIGVIRAAQTLAQLAEGYEASQAAIETVEITDWAAFKLRGYMHDVGRSFISVDELKKHIDLLSRFKVNTFHWHFTENQAWRFEVEGYPQLTADTSMTRFAGQYYTQEQCREVAQYATERGVTVIPEIDMPGHSEAFKRAMGYSMQTDEGVAVLKEVLTQLASVFPNAPYIHIGADEEAITYSKDGKGFLEIMAGHIRETLGRKLVVWNPIRNVAINSTMCDMTQMWSSSGTNINGVPDIDCRYNYTNHFDVFADVVGIYKSNIYYKAQGDAEVAGTISAYWNDRKMPTEEDIVKQNNLYANVLASAERAWIGSSVDGNAGYIEKLGTTLPNSGEVYEEFADWERRFLFHKANSLKDEPIPYVKQSNVRWRITDPFPNNGNAAATSELDKYATSTDDTGLIPETYTHDGKTYYTGMATGAGIYLRHTWGNNIIPTYYGSTNHSNATAYAWTYVYSDKEQKVGAQIEFQNYGRSEKDNAPDNGNWDRKGSDIWLNGERIAPPTWDNAGKSINNEVDLLNENFTARKPIEVTLKQGWNKVFIKLPYVGAGGVRLNKWMFTFVLTDLEGVNAVEGLIYSPNQCMDEATELVAAKVSEIKRDRGNLIGTAVGLWPESAAATLDAKVAEIEATYSQSKTEAEREAQIAELAAAWDTFAASLTNDNMNQPVSGNYYRMYTPLRGNRYATGNGVDAAITGPTEATTKASIWQFVSREDNSYDIINLADGTYISPASNNNTALKTVTEQPTAGWTIKKAETTGNVIVTSGSVQFNQQKDGNLYLLNWGSGTNITDDGCEYRLVDVSTSVPPQPIVKLERLGNETYPYTVDDALADKVFAKGNITIAVDVTMPASMSGRQVLVCAADPTQAAATSGTKTNSPYIAYGLYGNQPAYLASSKDGDRFTYKDFTFTASTNYKIVYVIDKENQKNYVYINGELKTTSTYPQANGYELQSFSNFATNTNAKLYIGSGAVSGNGTYDKFSGQIRSVQFFDGALTAEKVAMLEYPINEEDIILSEAVVANNNMDIHGMQRYYGLVQNAGTGIEGDGQLICNYPAATSQESGNAYANLIDGNYETFFHSGYGNTIGSGSHYLQANLNRGVKSFRFYMKRRHNTNNDRPTKITIEGSNDGVQWNEIKVISSGFPTNETVLDYYSEEITCATTYSKLRFTVNTTSSNKVFFSMSEFYLLPNNEKVAETFDAVRAYRAEATIATATALNEVYAWNKGLTKGEPIAGADHYLYVDTYKDGAFLNRYIYNNNGSATLTTTLQKNTDSYIWTAAVEEDGKWNFKNKAGKYLAHRGMSDSKHNFTVASTTHHMGVTLHSASGNYWVIKNADGGFDQSSVTYDQKTTNFCTDFVFIPADAFVGNSLTIVNNIAGAEATYRWNGVEFESSAMFNDGETATSTALECVSYNPIYRFVGFYSDEAMTEKITEIAELTADITVYAKFELNVFSTAYGDKWVRLSNCSNNNYWATLESTAANGNGKTATLDFADEKQLWCLVGSAESFVLYNKAAGETLALNVPLAADATGYADGNQASLTTEKGTWKLKEQSFGYALIPTEKFPNNERGINMWAGNGGNLKLYATAEGNKGSYWTVQLVDFANPLSLSVVVDQVWEDSPRVAEMTLTINGTNSSTRIEGNVDEKKMYLPAGATFSLSSMTYRGYTFNGFGGEDSYTDATLPEGGLNITASYTANEERTLYYNYGENGKPYRIPAIATAPNGHIFAIADNRPCGNDIGYGEVDIKCRISTDNGYSWGDEFFVADGKGGDTNEMTTGFGDAAIVADRDQNKLLVMMVCGRTVCHNGRWDKSKIGDTDADAVNRVARVYATYNETSGEWEWTQPVEMTDHIYSLFLNENDEPTVTSMFIGSGKICQSRVVKKDDYYRLYCSMWTRDGGNRVIYSDDFGGSWNVLGTIADRPASGGDEPKVEELPDGTVVLSSRKGGGRYFNLFTFADDTYTTGSWGTVVSSNNVENGLSFGGNTTNGEIYKVKAIHKESGRICDLMFQSIPTGGDRSNVAVYYKEMVYGENKANEYTPTTFAQNWTKGIHVSTKGSCYSTMIMQADGHVAFLFEEHPGDNYSYCIVYIPYTIEDLTADQYTLYTVESSIGQYGIGTFYASEAMAIPEGVKAYVATESPVMENGTGVITMTELTGIIPAETGAVIRSEAPDTYKFIPSISYGTSVENNMMEGYEAADNKAGSYKEVSLDNSHTTYVLAVEKNEKEEDVVGFYKKDTDFNVYNNKAYLQVPTTVGVRSLAIRFDGDGTTGIENSELSIFNSQFSIFYDLMGRRVVNPTKGVYIINGKKVIK